MALGIAVAPGKLARLFLDSARYRDEPRLPLNQHTEQSLNNCLPDTQFNTRGDKVLAAERLWLP
jgi:hypothetical protein